MLISSMGLEEVIEARRRIQLRDAKDISQQDFDSGFGTGLRACLLDIQKVMEKNPLPERPCAQIFPKENAVVLYCNPKLMEFLLRIRDSSDEVSIVEVARIYLEAKKLLTAISTVSPENPGEVKGE